MNIETRKKTPPPSPGPWLAEVTNHLDKTYMGILEVALIKGMPGSTRLSAETYPVRYLSPFAGNTSVRFEGNNSSDFNDVQKSYGFWMIPPDIGTTVMVIFIDGDANQGFWFGCVQDAFQNHMTPGIAASQQSAITKEQFEKYGTSYLPVGEFHKSSRKLDNPNPEKFQKPVHPIADRLLDQGLLLDLVRGVTSSGSRREVPSAVFGISTPGPLDTSPGAKRGEIGYDQKRKIPVSRLGGTTFVMDDGDVNGQNELVRIRTRTGHQILFHNSHDLIYIANSKGTAWIELTSNGKIDIFAQDSVSIHTEQDFNFRADRDINIEALRNINIRAGKNMETNVSGYQYLTVDGDQKISVAGSKNETIRDDVKFTAGNNFDFGVGENLIIGAGGGLDVAGEKHTKLATGGDFHIGASGGFIASAQRIDWNGIAADAPAVPTNAEIPPDLPLFSLPNRKKSVGWTSGKKYKSDDIKSIMQRVPTHEPWDQHESINPQQFTPESTDVTLADRTTNGVPPNPASAAGGSQNPQQPANNPEIVPGTCDSKFAKDINSPTAQSGIAALKAACTKYGITSPYAIASLLGIAGGECGWKTVEEGFNYSASRLLQVFPSVFKGDQELAQRYAGNPNNSLPEFLYGYQSSKGKGLGNTEPGDGGKFIGRGYIQLTGRSNYQKYGQMIGKDLISNPKSLNDSTIAAEVSVKYLLDRVKIPQTDPGYFEVACKAVGYNTSDIKAKKKGYYECFLGQLKGGILGAESGGIVTDSQGNPIRTGSSQ